MGLRCYRSIASRSISGSFGAATGVITNTIRFSASRRTFLLKWEHDRRNQRSLLYLEVIMKLGIIGDAHLGSTDFSDKRRADFSGAFCRAIEVCRRNGAEVICLLGDVFDSAVMRRNVDAFASTLTEIAPTLVELKQAGIPLLAIAGNHEFGRGREAGELRVLEALGYLRVLRAEEIVIGGVGICGIPWQEEPADIVTLASDLARSSSAKRRVLLIHNFVRGAQAIPERLWEVGEDAGARFDRVFAGHHHVAEEVGRFVIPGSTEIQNMEDVSEKCVVVYNTSSQKSIFHPIPGARPVRIFEYDVTGAPRSEILARIERDLDSANLSADTFVYLRITGSAKAGDVISRAEIQSLFRRRDLFDRCIDLRFSTEIKAGAEVIRGASIDHLLRRRFTPSEQVKAKQYIERVMDDDFWMTLRDRILS
jgi:DNA repair exonuclease SbcCD nuclease subunit